MFLSGLLTGFSEITVDVVTLPNLCKISCGLRSLQVYFMIRSLGEVYFLGGSRNLGIHPSKNVAGPSRIGPFFPIAGPPV